VLPGGGAIEEVSPREFTRGVGRLDRPVVARGFASHWSAVDAARQSPAARVGNAAIAIATSISEMNRMPGQE